jgi:hypothetical protein
MTTPKLPPETVRLTKDRLDELEAKERAHDDYVMAVRLLSQRATKVETDVMAGRNPYGRPLGEDPAWAFAIGYRAAVRAMSETILEAGRRRDDLELDRRLQRLEDRLDAHVQNLDELHESIDD